jgi:hypothetical protein
MADNDQPESIILRHLRAIDTRTKQTLRELQAIRAYLDERIDDRLSRLEHKIGPLEDRIKRRLELEPTTHRVKVKRR